MSKIGFIIILYIIFQYLFDYLFPFFLAYIIASFFYHHSKSKIRSICSLTLFYLAITIILILIIIISIHHLKYAKSITTLIYQLLINYQQYIIKYIPNLFESSFQVVPKVMMMIISIFGSYLFLLEFNILKQYLIKLNVYYHLNALTNYILKYFKAMIIISIITFILLFIGYYLLNIPYPFFLAFLTSFFDLLPLIGIGIILLPMAFIYYVIGAKTTCISIIILYMFINIIRTIIEPKIYSNQFKIPTFLMFLLVSILFQLFSLKAMIIVPITLYFFQQYLTKS